MLCVTEISPPKAPDGRSVLFDATTATQFRTFRHGIVDDKSASNSPNSNDDFITGSTVSFAPNLGCGTIFCAQETSVVYNYSLAQSSHVLRCLLPERLTAQCVSPCGNYLALGGASGAVYFLSLLTGEMLWMRRGHVRAVTCLAFSNCNVAAGGGLHQQAALLASSSVDTTCRIIKLGVPAEDPSSVVAMTGHSLCVTACTFMKYVNRLVSVSRDRTCRISDALSGTVLRVFTASVSLSSVCVGPCDAVVACGGANGSIVFFKQLENTLVGEEIVAATAAVASSCSSLSSIGTSSATTSASKSIPINSLMKESGCSVFFDSSSSSASGSSDSRRVVGPFTGGPQSPILFLGDLFLQQDTSSTSSASACTISITSHEQPLLVAVSRDGFVQTYSWSTLAYLKDIQRFRKGIAAVCVVPPRFVKYAASTMADKPLVQKSALQLKKAPTSSAGARAFLVKALWNVQQQPQQQQSSRKEDMIVALHHRHTPSSSTLFYRIRQRDETNQHEEEILKRNEDWLRSVELEVMKAKEEELLVVANELFAAKAAQQFI